MRKQAKKKVADFKRPAGFDRKEGEEWEDIDEHERDVFDKDGYYDVNDTEQIISSSDLQILDKFKTDSDKPVR